MNKPSHPSKIDMTTGPVLSKVLLFAFPLVIGNILQQLYTTIDTIVIGKYCDSASLAAVSTSSQPYEIFTCIFLGIGAGTSILVSQYTGSGEGARIGVLLRSATNFMYCVAIPLTVVGVLAGPPVLKLMNVPDDTFGYATVYLRILFIGTVGVMGYNINAGVLKGLGDSRSSLLFLLFSCICNIILDLLFVAVFANGVAGVAIATVISQYLSWVSSIVYIRIRYPELEYSIIPHKPEKQYLRDIIRIGLPLGFNTAIYSVGHLFVQSLVNTQGSDFMAGCSVATKIVGIANVAVTALSSAGATYAGQNYGARNIDRIRKGHLLIPFMSGAVTFAADALVVIFRYPILGFFTKDPAVIEYASFYMTYVSLSYGLYAVFNGIINYSHGVGEIKYPTIINIMALWMIRIPSAFIISKYFDGHYVVLCYPLSFIFGMTAMLLFYRSRKWKEIIGEV